MRSISMHTVDGTYDIGLDSTLNLAMVEDLQCVSQDTLLASQLLLGEFPFDTSVGVPYMQTLFQNKNPFAFEDALRREIMRVPNVTDVSDVSMYIDGDVLHYSVAISSTYGSLEI